MSSVLSNVPTKLVEAERCFKRACEEIISLNRKIEELSNRYDNARKQNWRSYRYNFRLQIAVVEGVRNMFYEYATKKADEISDLRTQVTNVELSDDDDYFDTSRGYTAVQDEEDDEMFTVTEELSDGDSAGDEEIDH